MYAKRCFGRKVSVGLWIGRCPCHPDEEGTLIIARGDHNQIEVGCISGCSTDEIVDASRLSVREFFGTFALIPESIAKVGRVPSQGKGPSVIHQPDENGEKQKSKKVS